MSWTSDHSGVVDANADMQNLTLEEDQYTAGCSTHFCAYFFELKCVVVCLGNKPKFSSHSCVPSFSKEIEVPLGWMERQQKVHRFWIHGPEYASHERSRPVFATNLRAGVARLTEAFVMIRAI